MKKIIYLGLALMLGTHAMAQNTIQLPAPDKNVKMSLYEALQNRKSTRSFSDRSVTDATLSQLLWAAVGINRPDGHLTAPTAVNAQDITVYVVRQDGAYLYKAKENVLEQVSHEDLRPAVASRQTFVLDAPVALVIVSDNAKFKGGSTNGPSLSGCMDAGYVSQNICLAAEALGLATVPRATMDKDALAKGLKLTDQQYPLINHPVGFAK
jgi:nitroreductase